MVRVAGKVFNCPINYSAGPQNADIEIIVPNSVKLTDEDIVAIKNADTLEELDDAYGEISGVIGVYALLGWQVVEMLYNGVRFRWQTYRTTDINQIRQDNEDLTQAVLELAQIIGGEANG